MALLIFATTLSASEYKPTKVIRGDISDLGTKSTPANTGEEEARSKPDIEASQSKGEISETGIDDSSDQTKSESIGKINEDDNKDVAEMPAEAEKSVMEESFDWFVKERNIWSSRIGEMGRSIDGFFADIDAANTSNDSFMKLGFFNVWRKEDGLEPDPRFRFRLDLPYTEEKLKLVIENEPDETLSLEERNRRNVLRKDETTEITSTGFLRFLSVFDTWKFRNDIGVRLRNPIDLFARSRASKSWDLEDGWVFRLNETASIFQSEGLGFTSDKYFEKKLNKEMFFRSKTQAQWLKTNDSWEFGQTFSISHWLNAKSASVYRLGWLGESQPNPRTISYFTNVTYRYKLFSDWFFFEITPELLFPRDDNFKSNPSLTFGVEIIFSE